MTAVAVPRRIGRPIAFLLLLLHTLWPALALADEPSKAGVVTTIQGQATVSRPIIPQPVPLKVRDDVFLRDRIDTRENSVVRVLLGGKALVTVRELSIFTITEEPGRAIVDLHVGRLAVGVAKKLLKPGESIEVRTPNAVASIRGSFLVADVVIVGGTTQVVGGALQIVGGTPQTTFTALQVSVPITVSSRADPTITIPLGTNQTMGVSGVGATTTVTPVQAATPQQVTQATQTGQAPKPPEQAASSPVAPVVVAEQVQVAAQLAEILAPAPSQTSTTTTTAPTTTEPPKTTTTDLCVQCNNIITTTTTTGPVIPSGPYFLVENSHLQLATGTSLATFSTGTDPAVLSARDTISGLGTDTSPVTLGGSTTPAAPVVSATGANISIAGDLLTGGSHGPVLELKDSTLAGSSAPLYDVANTRLTTSGLLAVDPSVLTLSGSLLSLNGATLTSDASLVTVAGSTITATGAGVPLFDVQSSTLSVTGTGHSLVSLNASTLGVNGPFLAATGASTSIEVAGPLLSLAGGSTFGGAGPFLRMSGGSLTADALAIGTGAGNKFTLAGATGATDGLLVDLSGGAHLTLRTLLEAPDSNVVTFGPADTQPLVRIVGSGSSLNVTGTNPLFELAGGTLPPVVGGGSDLVSLSRGQLSSAGPLLSIVPGANVGIGGALALADGARASFTGGTDVVTIPSGASLTTTRSLFSLTGGSHLETVGGGALIFQDPSLLILNNPVLAASGSTVSLSGALVNVVNSNPLTLIPTSSGLSVTGSGVLGTTSLATLDSSSLTFPTTGALLAGANSTVSFINGAPLLSLTDSQIGTPSTPGGGTLVDLKNGSVMTVSGPVLQMTNSTVNLAGALITGSGGSSFASVGPLVKMSGGLLKADALAKGAGDNNTLTVAALPGSTGGLLLDLSGASATFRTLLETAGNDVAIFAPAAGEPLIKMGESNLTVTGSAPLLSLEGPGTINARALVATNTSGTEKTLSLAGTLLDLKGLTLSSPDPQISLSNMTLTQSGSQSLVRVSGSPVSIAGSLLSATDSTVSTEASILRIDGTTLTTGAPPLFTLTGGTFTTMGAASDLVTLAGGTLTLGGALLSLTGTPTVNLGGDVLHISSAVTGPSSGSLVSVGGGSLSATGDFIDLGAGSTLTLSGPALTVSGGSVKVGNVLNLHAPLTTPSGQPFLQVAGGSLSTPGSLATLGANLTLGGAFLSQSGGTVTSNGDALVVQTGKTLTSGSTAVFDLSGGTLTTTGTSNLVTLSGGALNLGGTLAKVTGSATAVDLATGLTLGTDQPLLLGGSVLQMSGATGSAQKVVELNTAALTTNLPVLNLIAGSGFTTSQNTVDLVSQANLRSRANEVVRLAGSMLTVGSGILPACSSGSPSCISLVNVAGGSKLTGGDLVSLQNGSGASTLNIPAGTVLTVSDGSAVSLQNALVRFTGSGNVLNATNSLGPTAIVSGVPVFVAPGVVANLSFGENALSGLGPSGAININGASLGGENPITGSLIAVIGPAGLVNTLTIAGLVPFPFQVKNLTLNLSSETSLAVFEGGETLSPHGGALVCGGSCAPVALGEPLVHGRGSVIEIIGSDGAPIVALTDVTVNASSAPLVSVSGTTLDTSRTLVGIDPTTVTLGGTLLSLSSGTLTSSSTLFTAVGSTIDASGTIVPRPAGTPLIDVQSSTLTLTGAGNGILSLDNSAVTVNGPALKTTSSTVNVSGPAFQLANTSSLTTTGVGSHLVGVNGGNVTFGGGLLSLSGTPTVTIGGDVLNITGSATVTGPSSGSLVSVGVGNVTVGDDVVELGADSTLNLNGPALTVSGGNLRAANVLNLSAPLTTSSGQSLLQVTGGTLSTVKLASLGANLTLNDSFLSQSGGTVSTSGDALAVGAFTLDSTGTTKAIFALTGGELDVTGHLVSLNGGTLNLGAGGVLSLSGGTANISGKVLDVGSTLTATGSLLTVTAGTLGDSVKPSALLGVESPLILPDQSLLSLSGTGTVKVGTVFTNANALATLTTGSAALLSVKDAGSTLQATNSLAALGANLTLNGAFLSQSGGTVTAGADALAVGSKTLTSGAAPVFDLSGGTLTLTGAGTHLVSANGGSLNVSGPLASISGSGQLIATASIEPLVSLSGGTHSIATTSGRSVVELTGTAVDPVTGLGTAAPLRLGGALFATSAGATVSTQKILKVDAALLAASLPLLLATGGSSINTTVDAIHLIQQASLSSTSAELIKLDGGGGTMTVASGALVNVAGGSKLTAGGDFLHMRNAGASGTVNTLNIANGTLLSVSGGSVVTINGFFIRFTGPQANTINVTNNLAPTRFFDGIPVFLAQGVVLGLKPDVLEPGDTAVIKIKQNSINGMGGGNPSKIVINGTQLPNNATGGITGSLIAVSPGTTAQPTTLTIK